MKQKKAKEKAAATPLQKNFRRCLALTGLYLFIMLVHRNVMTIGRRVWYLADPPTPEQIVWNNYRTILKGAYWLEWLLPLAVVWAAASFLWGKRGQLVLLAAVGAGIPAALAYTRTTLVFIVKENSILLSSAPWGIWAAAVAAFLLALTRLRPSAFPKGGQNRFWLLAAALALAAAGGVMICFADPSYFNNFVVVRSLVLAALLYTAAQRESCAEEAPPADIRWALAGACTVLVMMQLRLHLDTQAYGSLSYPRPMWAALIVAGLLLWQTKRQLADKPQKQKKAGWALAGLAAGYAGAIVLITETRTGFLVFGRAAVYYANAAAIGSLIGNAWRQQGLWLLYCLALVCVAGCLRLQKVQALACAMGMGCVWYYLFFIGLLGRGNPENAAKLDLLMIALTGLFALAPAVTGRLAKAGRRARCLAVAALGAWRICMMLLPVAGNSQRLKNTLRYFRRGPVAYFAAFALCRLLELALLVGAAAYTARWGGAPDEAGRPAPAEEAAPACE